MKYKFKVVLMPIQEPGFEGQYTVTVPSLPGIVTQGKNKQDALKMAEEAIALHIEDMLEENEIIPNDFEDTVELEIKINK
ncbi:MAG: type II toxin-antitoxin system HicB family antitoxin [Candidatus Melainabacteria bacterium]|nr:type II toxin-antitoxin system HicB family antitoxin [Candidatus Melainabacteria bacterium]